MSGLDRRIDGIVLRCLEKNPAARYPSADVWPGFHRLVSPALGPRDPELEALLEPALP